MSTITNILWSDLPKDSRAVINDNFSNLNTDKAEKSNVLELDNTTPFTPDADYEPATKKYVDDNSWASTFIDLTDTPASYVWQAGKVPIVNGTEDWLEFTSAMGTWDFKADGTVPMTGDLNLNGNDIIGLNLDGVNDVATTTEATADILIKDWANWVNSNVMTQDQLTGFADNTNITVTYSHTNRTTTLTHPSGTLTYYYRGVKKTLTSPWVSSAHVDVTANYFLYSTDGTNFSWSTTPWNFRDVMVAYVRFVSWSAATTFALREVHGLLDTKAHQILHSQIGTHRVSGWELTTATYTENTATNAATTPWFDSAVIRDEDIDTTIPALTEWSYTQMYIGAGNTATFVKWASYPFTETGSYLQVNNTTTWAMTNWVTGRYYNVYQILVPCTADSDSQSFRMIFLQPQATHTSLANALIEDPRSLNLGNFANLATEWVIYARITYVTSAWDTNAGKCRIATGWVTYIVGNRGSQTSVSGFNPTDHTVLDNLDWASSGHTWTASSVATFDWSWNATSQLLSTIVQTTGDQTVAWVKTFTDNQLINVNTANNALEIRQTWAWNALYIEDSANPDTSPFVISTNWNIWIWTTTLNSKLNIKCISDDAGGWIQIESSDIANRASIYRRWSASWEWLLFRNQSIDTMIMENGRVSVWNWVVSPNTSAALDIQWTTKGFLPPRMTTAQRDAITSPAEWLLVYNTTTDKLNTYSWSAWQEVWSGWASAPFYETNIEGQCYLGIIARFTISASQTLTWVKISLWSLPTGANFRLAIRKNSTSTNNVITAWYIEITTTESATNGIYTVTNTTLDATHKVLAENDILYVIISQIGSTLPASDLYCKVY